MVGLGVGRGEGGNGGLGGDGDGGMRLGNITGLGISQGWWLRICKEGGIGRRGMAAGYRGLPRAR